MSAKFSVGDISLFEISRRHAQYVLVPQKHKCLCERGNNNDIVINARKIIQPIQEVNKNNILITKYALKARYRS